MTALGAGTKIRRRQVFYVMGFDPRGPDFYHALLRRESRIAARQKNTTASYGPLLPDGANVQISTAAASENAPEVRYTFLAITDFVAPYFRQPIMAQLAGGLRVLLAMWLSGFIWRCFRHCHRFALFTLYPFVLLASVPLVAWPGVRLAADALAPAPWGDLLAGAGGFAVAALWCVLLRRTEARHFVYYLLGDFVFSHAAVTGRLPALDSRLAEFSRRVSAALANAQDDEEVLIVGHSSGSLLAARLAAEVCRARPAGQTAPLTLLTLGSQFSLGYFSGTAGFLADLQGLADDPRVIWREIFAPQDVISSGRFDPLRRLGIRPGPGDLALVSARLREAMRADHYAAQRYRFFRLHMHYLRASETGAGFNYPALLASPQRLRESL